MAILRGLKGLRLAGERTMAERGEEKNDLESLCH